MDVQVRMCKGLWMLSFTWPKSSVDICHGWLIMWWWVYMFHGWLTYSYQVKYWSLHMQPHIIISTLKMTNCTHHSLYIYDVCLSSLRSCHVSKSLQPNFQLLPLTIHVLPGAPTDCGYHVTKLAFQLKSSVVMSCDGLILMESPYPDFRRRFILSTTFCGDYIVDTTFFVSWPIMTL